MRPNPPILSAGRRARGRRRRRRSYHARCARSGSYRGRDRARNAIGSAIAALTPARPRSYCRSPCPGARRWCVATWIAHEADVPAEPDPSEASARLPEADEHARGTERPQAASCQGPQADRRLDPLEVAVARATGRFRRSERLLRSSEYEYVAQQGRRAGSGAFIVVALARGAAGPSRLGITASRRVGNAVARNRVKRRVREWFRGARSDWGCQDVVVIARQPATLLAFDELSRQLSGLLRRAMEAS